MDFDAVLSKYSTRKEPKSVINVIFGIAILLGWNAYQELRINSIETEQHARASIEYGKCPTK